MLALDPATIATARACFARGGAPAEHLLQRAEEALRLTPASVMDKRVLPPSGDAHDYLSLGTYWWPDPSKADGLPYIRRDGHVNPEVETLDRPRLSRTADAVALLAAAAVLSGQTRFAARAELLLATWFLAPATRMHAHLRYGQGIPGICAGRGIGIIDSECLVRVCDALVLLRGAGLLTPQVDAGMNEWLAAYLDWLLASDLGRAEAGEANNHGTCYDVQVVGLARHLGRSALARDILAAVPLRRIAPQVLADGRQPLELARARAWSYSLKNLMALLNLAGWGRELGVPLWEYRNDAGAGIPTVLAWLAPFALGRTPWIHQEVGGFHAPALAPVAVRAATLDPALLPLVAELGATVEEVSLDTVTGCPLGAIGTLSERGFHG